MNHNVLDFWHAALYTICDQIMRVEITNIINVYRVHIYVVRKSKRDTETETEREREGQRQREISKIRLRD